MPANSNIKVMYLNPVATADYDQVFVDMIKEYKHPATDAYVASLNPSSSPSKMTNLEYRTYESFTELDTVKAARYCAINGFDAMVIGCFYDPTLQAAREISGSCVVVAPCQSSCTTALAIANKFSIIIGRYKWEDQMKEAVYGYGYGDKLASFEAVGLRVEEFHKDPVKTKKLLLSAATNAVKNHRAEAIILGCTLEVGFYKELMSDLLTYFGCCIPVIDPSIAAFKTAEDAAFKAKIGWSTSKVWGMEAPAEDELKKFDVLQKAYQFGNLVHIQATK